MKGCCSTTPELISSISEYEDLYSTLIANCFFNNFLCYTAIMLNIVTIHAIRKTSSLPKSLRTLLLSLAVSDVGVGLLVQPFHTSLLAKWLQQSIPSCSTYKISFFLAFLFATASFFGVVAVSVDGFLAIHLHLRYQELVTHKRVVAVVISIWVLSAFLSVMPLWDLPGIHILISICISIVVGLLLTTLVYIRIYLTVRRHKNQIQVLQLKQIAQTSEMGNFTSLVKSVVGIFYVYLVFLVCYFPFFVSLAATKIYGPSIALKKLNLFSSTLVFLNSSLNPVIYCWKMRHIRHVVVDIPRNMLSWYRNCEIN